LAVHGNSATAYGIVTKSVDPDAVPDADWVSISVTDKPDTFLAFFGFGDPPCDFFQSDVYSLSHGNVEVRER
jgi:hypothetical protein